MKEESGVADTMHIDDVHAALAVAVRERGDGRGGADEKVEVTQNALKAWVDLLVTTGGGSKVAISLFDAKSELSRLSERLVATLAQHMDGTNPTGSAPG